MNLDEFEQVTNDAFGFLSRDHGYTALPAERGGTFGTAFLRRFERGRFQIIVSFGDADAHHLCAVVFRDDLGETIAESSYMARDLLALLADRYPAFSHPTRADLSDEVTPRSILEQYAALLEDYAADVVDGDFSAFPTLVYVLYHVDRGSPGRAVRRLLGVYSTYENATAAIEDRRTKPGYSERADGFEIWKAQLDGMGFWFAGIPLDSARDDHG